MAGLCGACTRSTIVHGSVGDGVSLLAARAAQQARAGQCMRRHPCMRHAQLISRGQRMQACTPRRVAATVHAPGHAAARTPPQHECTPAQDLPAHAQLGEGWEHPRARPLQPRPPQTHAPPAPHRSTREHRWTPVIRSLGGVDRVSGTVYAAAAVASQPPLLFALLICSWPLCCTVQRASDALAMDSEYTTAQRAPNTS